MFCIIVCHTLAYNNELGEVVEYDVYEMSDPLPMFGWNDATDY